MTLDSPAEQASRHPDPVRAGGARDSPRVPGRQLFLAVAPFALIVYLGLEGGGFDPILYGRFGIAVWSLLLVGAIAGALSLGSLSSNARIAVLALAAFVVWVGLSMLWSESAGRSAQELARASTYLGVLVLFATAQTRAHRHLTLGSVAAGIAFIAVLALLSRMEPEVFPKNETLDLVRASQERLNYPLNYWNGLAGLIAIGAPLLTHFAACAQWQRTRILAGAALPALILAVYLTLSRGGWAALLIGLLALIALHPRRLAISAQLVVAALAAGVLVWAAESRSGFVNGIRVGEGLGQGDEMLAIALVVCALAGLWPLAAERLRGIRRPRSWPFAARARLLIAGGAAAALLGVALLAGLPAEIGDGWEQFKESGVTRGSDRLESASGNGRYQWWDSALAAGTEAPVLGIGAGTFQFWWAREGTIPGQVIDAHSLYFESLAELGLVGLLLIAGFVAGSATLLGLRARRGPPRERGLQAVAAAAVLAFATAAATDWAWELPVQPVALMIILGAAQAGAAAGIRAPGRGRLALAAVAVLGIVAIVPPLLGTGAIRASQERARAGELEQALDDADRAARVEPYSGAAALQRALVLEQMGRLGPAASAAREATDEEATNWETWLTLSRIEIERGRVGAGLGAFRRARALNPSSGLFDPAFAAGLG